MDIKRHVFQFFDPFNDPQNDGFQLVNSFIGIASGGLNGRGLGNSVQKYGYLPEPQTDFIMAIISEELGFIGVAIILICLLLIIIRSFRIAQNVTILLKFNCNRNCKFNRSTNFC